MSDSETPAWTAAQEKAQEWLAMPRANRTPKTQEEFATSLGVNERTFRRWTKLPGFMTAVRQIAKTYLHDSMPEIYEAIAKEAIDGNYQMARLALELTGEVEAPGTSKNPFELKIVYVNDWRDQ